MRSLRPRSLLSAGAEICQETYIAWRGHRTIRLGAGLAYYGLFAIVPLVMVVIALTGTFFSQPEVQEAISDALNDLVGEEGTQLTQEVAAELDEGRIAASLGAIGAVSLLITGSLAFLALQDALNVIWQQPVQKGFLQSLRRRGLALGVVVATAALVIFAAAILAFASLVNAIVPGDIALLESLSRALGAVLVLALATGALALLFRLLVYSPPPWRYSLTGSAVTVICMVAGSWVIGIYLDRVAGSSFAGAAGAAVLLLTWIYFEAQILLGGAELTRVLAVRGTPDDGKPPREPERTAGDPQRQPPAVD